MVVCHVLASGGGKRSGTRRSVVWLPLRANAEEIGALVGISESVEHVDPSQLDTAAVLAAHCDLARRGVCAPPRASERGHRFLDRDPQSTGPRREQ